MTHAWGIFAALTPCLAVLCYYDCRYRKLPNFLTFGLMTVAAVWRLGYGGWPLLLNGLAGGLLAGAFLLLPFYLRGAGGGDVKMLAACGTVLGAARIPLLLLATSVAGLVLMAVMLTAGLASGSRLRHLFRSLCDWRYDRRAGRAALPPRDDERVRVPFGGAIAVGTWATLIVEIARQNGGGQ